MSEDPKPFDTHPRKEDVTTEELEKRAESGDSDAMVHLAVRYLLECSDEVGKAKGERTESVKRKEGEVIRLLQSAVGKGNPDALSVLGNCFLRGVVVEMDQKKGFEMLTRAADEGSGDAMMKLRLCYKRGIFVDPDAKRAHTLHLEGKKKGGEIAELKYHLHHVEDSVDEMVHLSHDYLYGSNGCEKDLKRAFELAKGMFDMGFVMALSNMATALIKADDIEKGLQVFERGVYLGDELLMASFAKMLDKGDGIPKNPKKGIELYERAAKLGNSLALLNLGRYYCYGYRAGELRKNLERAAELLELACKRENRREALPLLARLYLGEFRLFGDLRENQRRAVELLQEAEKEPDFAEAHELVVEMRRPYKSCFNWMEGCCRFGLRCKYKHDISEFGKGRPHLGRRY